MWKKWFRFFSSLQLAVCIILFLAAALAAGTIIESMFDIQTGRFWVYRTWWFSGLLATLGINIFAVAMSRYPWKRRQIPFLSAHLGILLLLFGSLITQKNGLDGSLIVGEGERSALVQLQEPVLYLSDENGKVEKVGVPWIPPNVHFRPITIWDGNLTITQFITHAESEVLFHESHDGNKQAAPAIELHLTGGPMNFSERFWLWGGSSGWREVNLGPVRFILLDPKYPKDLYKNADSKSKARLQIKILENGQIHYEAKSMRGKIKKGKFNAEKIQGKQINTRWMQRASTPLRLKVLNYYRYAQNDTRYVRSRNQYGDQAPESAIQLRTREGKEFWMTLGDRQIAPLAKPDGTNQVVQLNYVRDRRILPFEVELNRFEISKYQGGMSPMGYSSYVKVHGLGAPDSLVHISMNQPLEFMKYTLYQSSYVPAQPRPTVSIFTVNQDPGRIWKYLGSILIVLGAILLFAVKYFRGNRFFDFLRGK